LDRGPVRGRTGARRAAPGGCDGYIDSVANTVSEAGGSLPRMALIIMIALIIAYFAYLIIYWQPA
jgi:uncharacterized membrane protein